MLFRQTHRPGAEAEVDFGEVAVNLRGELVTCVMFYAFTALGGVPDRQAPLRHLRAAVAQVLGFARQHGSRSQRH